MPSNIMLSIKTLHGTAAEERNSDTKICARALSPPLSEDSLGCALDVNPATQIFGTDCWTQALKIVENSCRKLSSEQQARFAVALYNCHMRMSGKKTTTCTEDMSIKVSSTDATHTDGNAV